MQDLFSVFNLGESLKTEIKVVEKEPKIRLGGNHGYKLKEGWINKGMRAVLDNPCIFKDKYACDYFGIGNSMVPSLKYWLKAFSLVYEEKGAVKHTDIGKLLYENDPYLEDMFSLWLLHVNLLHNEKAAPVINEFFHDRYEYVSRGELSENLLSKWRGADVSIDNISKDVGILFQMYYHPRNLREDPEDNNISPLTKLGLVNKDDDYYRKTFDARIVSDDIAEFVVCLLFSKQKRCFNTIRSISLEEMLNEFRIMFNLPNYVAMDFAHKLENLGIIIINNTVGLGVVYEKAVKEPIDVVRSYYGAYCENEYCVG